MRLAPASTIEPSRIRAVASLADEHPGTLRLFYGEDTLPTPDFIKAAAHRAVDANLTYYTPNAGYPALRAAIARTLSRLHGLDRDPSGEIVVTASGMVALHLACLATLGPGTSALVVTPAWPNIPAAVKLAGAEAVEVPLTESGTRFGLDLERLETSVRADTRALIVTSPSNPTGWTATRGDWTRILGFCERHDLWLIADGVYERLVAPGEVALCPLAGEWGSSRTILASSFSKTYRMTGWRVGYLVAPREAAGVMTHLQEFVVSHASGIAQEAARVALLEGEEFVLEQQTRYARHRSIAVDRLKTFEGVELSEPAGAFYVFPRLEGLTDSLDFCERLVREHGLGLAPGSAFGLGGEGHVRMCFAVDETTLRAALDRFEAGWRSYRERLSPVARGAS